MHYIKKISIAALVGVASLASIFGYDQLLGNKSFNEQDQVLTNNVQTLDQVNVNSRQTAKANNLELTDPTNLNYEILADLKNVDTNENDFLGTTVLVQQFQEIRQAQGYGSQDLKSDSTLISKEIKKTANIGLNISSTSPIDGSKLNNFSYSWNGENLNVNGSYQLSGYKTKYDNIYDFVTGNGWFSSNANIYFNNISIQPTNIDFSFSTQSPEYYQPTIVDNGILKYWKAPEIDFFDIVKALNNAWIENNNKNWTSDGSWTGANAYEEQKATNGFGWTWGAGNQFQLFGPCWKRGVKVWTQIGLKENDLDNENESINKLQAKLINDLENFESVANFGSVMFDTSIIKLLFDAKDESQRDGINLKRLKYDNTGNIWSGATINQNTRNVLNFSKYFWWIKTLDYCNDLINKINQEIVLKNQSWPVEINKIAFNDKTAMNNLISKMKLENWENNGLKESIALFFQQLWEMKFKNMNEIENYYNKLIDNNNFTGFKGNEGIFSGCYEKIKSGFPSAISFDINTLNFENWNEIYNGILEFLRSYDLCINVSIYQNRKKIPVMDIDNNGNETKLKTIKLWDGQKGEFNWNFINDFGTKNIEYNIIEFTIDNIFLEPTNLKNKTNRVYIDTNEKINVQFGTGDLKNEHFILNYRFNAVPIDTIILSEMYEHKYAEYFNIKSDKTINQLVYLNNEKEEIIDENGEKVVIEHSINDLIVNDKIDARKIILKSMEDSILGFVTKTSGYGKNYPVFSDIICGIGINDLNNNFGFDTENPFFDLASWRTALNKFEIKFDKKNKRYPIYAATHTNNTIYVIATINNWYFQDGTHGDYEGCWKDIVSNKIRYDRSNPSYPKLTTFNGLQEIKPVSRINDDGSWNNKGYFLLKMNVGNQWGGWNPNVKLGNYAVTNWNEIMEQLIAPPQFDNEKPFKNAGITQFMLAKDKNNNLIYWKNNKYQVIEETFFEETSYWLDNWELDINKMFNDLGLDGTANKNRVWMLKAIRSWILSSNKLSYAEMNEQLLRLSTVDGENEIVKEALKWFINNCMVKVELTNYWFSGIESLKYDKLFNKLIDFHGYDFNSLFAKKLIYVEGESTGQYKLVPNEDKYNFSFDNWSMYNKVILNDNLNYSFSNKTNNNTNAEGVKMTLRIPVNMLRELIYEENIFYAPNEWYDNQWNPYGSEDLLDRNPYHAFKLLYGMSRTLPKINYKEYVGGEPVLIKQDEKSKMKVLNIVIVSLAPIVGLLIIAAIAILISIIAKKIKIKC